MYFNAVPNTSLIEDLLTTTPSSGQSDWRLGANVLSERMQGLLKDLQALATKDHTTLVLERLPTLSVHGYPSFDSNGVDNFFFSIRFNDPASKLCRRTHHCHQKTLRMRSTSRILKK
jgi:hypothetical protein